MKTTRDFVSLLEEGVYEHDHLSDDEFEKLIHSIYNYILGVARDGFF